MKRIETDAHLGSDPSLSVSSVFPSSLMLGGSGIQDGTLTEIPRLAALARNDNGQLRSLGMTGGSLATREDRDLLARRTSRAYGSRPPRNRALPSPLAPRPSPLAHARRPRPRP